MSEDLSLLLDNALIPRLLGDLDELLGSVYVGGLVYPDPDLPSDLRDIGERAANLGLSTATEYTRRLADGMQAMVAESDRASRRALAVEVWDELQRLVCWQRIFRTEHAFMVVAARLAQSGEESAISRPAPTYPTESRRVFPFGIELAGPRVVLWCQDLDSGDTVVLIDELVECSDTDPLHLPAISRLFQDSVRLRDVLGSVIFLDEHPVATNGGRHIFAPAFATRPTIKRVAAGYQPPRLPEIPLRGAGSANFDGIVGAGRLALVVSRNGDRVALRTRGGIPIGLAVTPALRANALKLLMRDRVASAEFDAVVVQRRHGPKLLRVDDELEGPCFPVQDPRLFRLSPTRLAADLKGGGLPSLSLRAALAREADAGLVADLEQFIPADIEERFVREWARAAVAEPGLPTGIPQEVVHALLAEEGGFGALWLAHRFRLTEDLLVQLRALYDHRYSVLAPDASISDICSRALLLAWLEIPDGNPVGFMEAHISALRLSARTRMSTLPDAAEICWLAETLAILTGDEREAGIGRSFDIPLDRILELVTEALWRWRSTPEPAGSDLRAARDALWLARKTGCEGYFLAIPQSP